MTVAVLNGLMDVGYAEDGTLYAEHTDEETFRDKLFEVNPSYALGTARGDGAVVTKWR